MSSESNTNEPVLLRSDSNGIATLTLNRSSNFNTLSTELMTELQIQLDNLMTSREIRVVIIAGNGPAFCAGHDLSEMRSNPEPYAMNTLFTQCSKLMASLTKIPQPTIARVHGVATAAGCQLVAQCDLAVCSEDATFGTSGVKIGLFCSTPMVAVTRNLPRKQAMEMLLTGDLIDSKMAEHYGLVNRVVPAGRLDSEIMDLATKISLNSPAAIRRGKHLFYSQIEKGLEAAYLEATEAISSNMQDHDARAGIDAFMEKRPMPDWEGQ